MDIFAAFVNTHAEAPALLDRFTTALTRFGLQRFAYIGARLPRSGTTEPVIVTNYPDEWSLRYNERYYAAVDPILQQAPHENLPFQWRHTDRGLAAGPAQRLFLGEASEFGISSGLMVPVHGRDGEFGMVSYVSDEKSGDFRGFLDKHRHQLHLLAIYYHAHISDSLAVQQVPRPTTLTLRERDCLSWKAEGKSNQDIGDILGISAKTVDFHLTNIRRKFGVATNQQAVVIALLRGMIHPQLPPQHSI
jgi:LuxR family transcriptional regulator, activator of conjugal transfer of Ti plasmids